MEQAKRISNVLLWIFTGSIILSYVAGSYVAWRQVKVYQRWDKLIHVIEDGQWTVDELHEVVRDEFP